jgi:hypothetical protein
MQAAGHCDRWDRRATTRPFVETQTSGIGRLLVE